jgi:hypothetical protein
MGLADSGPPLPISDVSFGLMAISSTATAQILNNSRVKLRIFQAFVPCIKFWMSGIMGYAGLDQQ